MIARRPLARIALAAGFIRAGAAMAAPALGSCLSEMEIRDEVAARRVVPQVAALGAAHSSTGGEAVKARLCRVDGGEGLVYAITALKRDGKVVRVYVDAASGRVIAE